MSSRTRQQLEAWAKGKTLFGTVVDVGGAQLPADGRMNFENVVDVKILDLPEPHEEKRKADIQWDLNQDIRFGFERMDLLGTFDFAVCLEVSEYWFDPVIALQNIHRLLKRGGHLIISFHFIYPVHNPVDQDYLRYTRAGVMKLLSVTGFEPVDVTPRTEAIHRIQDAFASEGMRPAKGYEFHNEVGLLVEAIKK